MPQKAFEVTIEPSVLIWARESIGMDINEVAEKMKDIPATAIKNWEEGVKNPPITLHYIEKLAFIYKRPISAFLLPAPPSEPSFPADFRTHQAEEKPLNSKTYLAIRKARRFQYSAIELAKELNESIKGLPLTINLQDDPEKVAAEARKQLGIDFEKIKIDSFEDTLERYIKIFEKNDILVFQISFPKNKEIRGFSLADEKIPVIVLRKSDETSARIFTLFHELAHILLKEGGICDLIEKGASQSIEKFSNHFAGAFLVPKNELLNYNLVKGHKEKEWPEDTLKTIAQIFQVSKEVILRRLLILNLTTKEYYDKMHEEWKSKYKERFGRGGKNPIKICIQERGKKYVSMVFNAYEQHKINNINAADYLGVKIDKISKVKEAI